MNHNDSLFQLFAYRAAHRIVDPHLANEDYMDGWINNAINRGLSVELQQKLRRGAEQFGRVL